MSLKDHENIALSNFDILKLLDNKAKIVLYPNIHNFRTLDELLEPYGCCVILYEQIPKYGHWCALMKTNQNTVEYFNPYLGPPDNSLDYIPFSFKLITNQFLPYLSILMYESPYKLSYNEFAFQRHSPQIRTCGRHCVVRLLCKHLDIYQYKKLLDKLCMLFKTDYDGVVTLLTMKNKSK